jgi:ferredoxin
MTVVNGTVEVNHELCSTCTQCIAVCPEQALSWDGVAPLPYDASRLPSAGQLDELFKERRSVRFFRKEGIDRALLEEIVSYGIHAPTTNQSLRAIVVDSKELIAALEQVNVQFNVRMYNLFFKPRAIYGLLSRMTRALNPKIRAKMETRRHELFNPAAIVFVVGERGVGLSEASAQAALDVITLYAWAKGIGSCLWGAGRISLNRSRAVRERLRLERHECIWGTLLLGYPAVRFRNKVRGKELRLQWNGG